MLPRSLYPALLLVSASAWPVGENALDHALVLVDGKEVQTTIHQSFPVGMLDGQEIRVGDYVHFALKDSERMISGMVEMIDTVAAVVRSETGSAILTPLGSESKFSIKTAFRPHPASLRVWDAQGTLVQGRLFSIFSYKHQSTLRLGSAIYEEGFAEQLQYLGRVIFMDGSTVQIQQPNGRLRSVTFEHLRGNVLIARCETRLSAQLLFQARN